MHKIARGTRPLLARRTELLASFLLGAALLACSSGSGPKQASPAAAPAATASAPAQKGTLPPSQTDTEVDRLFAAKLTQIRGSARELGQPLALYPDDLRAAVLEVARDPALIPRLADIAHKQGKGLDKLIAGEPAPVAEAARKLVKEPRLLDLLEQHLLVVGLVGALYADDPPGVRALLDQRARELDANEAAVVDDWKKRIDGDPDARAQLVAAQDAYEATTGDDADQAAGASQKGATTIIYAEPSYAFTTYVYGHCDVYWSLCGNMYAHSVYWNDYYDDYWDDYWDERDDAREDWQRWADENRDDLQQRGEERRQQAETKRNELQQKYGDRAERLEQPGNGGMGQAITDWKGKNAATLPADLLRTDGQINERFKRYGEADRSLREQARSGAAQPADRAAAISGSDTKRARSHQWEGLDQAARFVESAEGRHRSAATADADRSGFPVATAASRPRHQHPRCRLEPERTSPTDTGKLPRSARRCGRLRRRRRSHGWWPHGRRRRSRRWWRSRRKAVARADPRSLIAR